MKRIVLLFTVFLAGMTVSLADPYGFPEEPEGQPFSNKQAFHVMNVHVYVAFEVFGDAYQAAVDMRTAFRKFLKKPNQSNFDKAREAWIEARKHYGKTEVFRFANTPIDKSGLETKIDAWPINPSYIDYVEDNADSGIINKPDEYPEIEPSPLYCTV